MLPYAVLTAFFALVGSYLVTNLATGSLEERFNNQLIEASRVANDAVVRRERQHLAIARGIAYTDGLAQAVSAGDGARVSQLVEPVLVNAHAERVEVLNLAGERVFGTKLTDAASLHYEPIAGASATTEWSIVQDALAGRKDASGDKWAQITWTDDGAALYTAGPLYVDGNVVGAVLVGTPLASLVAAAKAEALADVTILAPDGLPLTSSFAVSADEILALGPSAEAVAALGASHPVREQKTLFNRSYEVLYGDLRVRNEVVGRLAVGLPTGFIANAGTTARWQTAALFGGVTAAVLVLGWVLALHLTGPLMRLVRTARRVAAGDLTARSRVHSADEIGDLAATFDDMTERLQRRHLATIGALASAIDARDPYTAGHSMRVGRLSVEIGREMGLDRSQVQHLEVGGLLHDIGKIGIRDNVLLKEGQLTPEERRAIEEHPRIGLQILATAELAPEVLAIVGGHHERLDGTGYPLGLTSEEITLFPRIASVADMYDALTTDRPYRTAMRLEEVLAMLRREARGGILDREVVETMARIANAWEAFRRDQRRVAAPGANALQLPRRAA